MTDPLFEADDEANTPLTPEGREGLIPTYITTRAELNEAEQENIAEADLWAFARKRGDVVDVDFLMSLHRRMLRRVWKWAGTQRTGELNIGVAPHRIAVDLHTLIVTSGTGSSTAPIRPTKSPSGSIIGSSPSIRFPTATGVMRAWPRTS